MTIKKVSDSNVSFLVNRISCVSCMIKNICLHDGSGSALRDSLVKLAQHPRPLHRGEHLFHQGDAFHNLYIVRTGSVKLYLTTCGGTEQILNFYFPGELLSLDSVRNRQHRTSAIALGTTSVCKLPFDRLMKLCHRQPQLYDDLFSLASNEISGKHSVMLMLGQKPIDERFAAFLLDITERCSTRDAPTDEIQLSMSRHDIANYLCVADETVSRLFTRFATEKVLDTRVRSIRILDYHRLRELANVRESAHQRALN